MNKITIAEFAQKTDMTVMNVHNKINNHLIEAEDFKIPGGRTIKVIDIDKYPIEDFGRVRSHGGGRKKV